MSDFALFLILEGKYPFFFTVSYDVDYSRFVDIHINLKTLPFIPHLLRGFFVCLFFQEWLLDYVIVPFYLFWSIMWFFFLILLIWWIFSINFQILEQPHIPGMNCVDHEILLPDSFRVRSNYVVQADLKLGPSYLYLLHHDNAFS